MSHTRFWQVYRQAHLFRKWLVVFQVLNSFKTCYFRQDINLSVSLSKNTSLRPLIAPVFTCLLVQAGLTCPGRLFRRTDREPGKFLIQKMSVRQVTGDVSVDRLLNRSCCRAQAEFWNWDRPPRRLAPLFRLFAFFWSRADRRFRRRRSNLLRFHLFHFRLSFSSFQRFLKPRLKHFRFLKKNSFFDLRRRNFEDWTAPSAWSAKSSRGHILFFCVKISFSPTYYFLTGYKTMRRQKIIYF